MNRIFVIAFAMLALVLGVLAFFQHADIANLNGKLADLQRELDAARAKEKTAGDELEKTRAKLADTKDFLEQKLAAASREAAKATTQTSAGGKPADAKAEGKEEGGFGGNFAKAFNTEEGKNVMRSQAAMQVKMMYGGLAKNLKLDPNTSAQVMQLIGERQSALTEASMQAMGKTGAEATAITEKMDQMGKDWDEKLTAVLGESGMTELKDYERTIGDRMMLSMHEQNFNSSGVPLAADQRDGLLKVMADERKNTPPSPMDGNGARAPGRAITAMRDESAVAKWLEGEQDFQRRVLQSATKVLNPDQINALGDGFKQQTDLLKLSAKMWGGAGKGQGTAAAPSAPVAK